MLGKSECPRPSTRGCPYAATALRDAVARAASPRHTRAIAGRRDAIAGGNSASTASRGRIWGRQRDTLVSGTRTRQSRPYPKKTMDGGEGYDDDDDDDVNLAGGDSNDNDFLPTRTFDLHVLPAHVPPPILPKSQYQPQISLLEGNVAPKLAYLKAKLPLTLILTLILCFGFSIYGRF